MYENLTELEKALAHFGTRVDIICALELGDKITADDAYKLIKEELKELKQVRKQSKKD